MLFNLGNFEIHHLFCQPLLFLECHYRTTQKTLTWQTTGFSGPLKYNMDSIMQVLYAYEGLIYSRPNARWSRLTNKIIALLRKSATMIYKSFHICLYFLPVAIVIVFFDKKFILF